MGLVDPIVPTKARVLRLEDQPSVDRYLEAFKRYPDDHHRLWDRVNDLTTAASPMTSAKCKLSFDAIDRDVTRAMLHAEIEARRPAGKYAWSPMLASPTSGNRRKLMHSNVWCEIACTNAGPQYKSLGFPL